MNLLKTARNDKPESQYYINGLRVSKLAFDDAKQGKYLDSFFTSTHKNLTRHYCTAR